MSATEGNEFEVQFAVTQDPPLLKGKKNILLKDDVAVSDDRVSIGESVVRFSSIQIADAGRYTITSSNGVGRGQGSFNLAVAGTVNSDIVYSGTEHAQYMWMPSVNRTLYSYLVIRTLHYSGHILCVLILSVLVCSTVYSIVVP